MKNLKIESNEERNYYYGINPNANHFLEVKVKDENDILFQVVEKGKSFIKSSVDKVELTNNPVGESGSQYLCNDVVYEINGDYYFITKQRSITHGEHQAECLVYSAKHKETKRQELIGKMYPAIGEVEGFLPASSVIVWMHMEDRFWNLVKRAQNR